MATVRQWTGREARILRLARRMSVRRFAEHLGVNPAAVTNWEKRGAESRLRYETQEMLDTDLARSPVEVRERFRQGQAEAQTAVTATAKHQSDGAAGDGRSPTGRGSSLGDRSSSRTEAILGIIRPDERSRLRYAAPIDVVQTISDLLASPSRVFVVEGPPGCGKTSLIYRMAQSLTSVDVQLLTADHWADRDVDLATEILRYGSTPARSDALLTLEQESSALSRPLVVIIDSPRRRDIAEQLCRDLDAILRQVLTGQLRFVMVFRTPPSIELSRYPVLSAAVMAAPGGGRVSLRLDRWDLAAARDVWNGDRNPDESPFDELPARIRNLARLPLYMHLIKVAGSALPTGLTSAYRLVEFCVRAIVEAAGGDATTTAQLSALSRREFSWVLSGSPFEAPVESTALHSAAPPSTLPLLRPTAPGEATFDHDVVREYFFATWLAQAIEARGRSAQTVDTLNSLAERTTTSADLHGILEFLLQCLDARSPGLLATVAQSPTISITRTLPLTLDLTGGNAAFAGPEVLRVCASRCLHDNGLALAKSLLRYDALASALGAEHPRWMLRVLRRFGAPVWPEIVSCVEARLPAPAVDEFVGLADLDTVEDAVFFARHFFVFFGDDERSSDRLSILLNHPDWRVRAALADGMRHGRVRNDQVVDRLVAPLTRDRDYKVRAAVAAAAGQLAPAVAGRHLSTLLDDPSWHVRERLLLGLATRIEPGSDPVELVLRDEHRWKGSPSSVRVAVQRLLLMSASPPLPDPESHKRALFGLLRELRSGVLHPAVEAQQRLIADGLASPDWLVRHEATAISGTPAPQFADIRMRKEAFRRLRDRRSVQVALDTRDLPHAIEVARAAAAAGAQFVEIGDPLIKSVGVSAIEAVKRDVPGPAIVAEMMSADWGRDQVVLAAEAGADVVLLIGPASLASVSAAAEASSRLALPLVIDVPEGRLTHGWVQDMERAGVDGFAITTNIDIGVAGFHPLDQAQLLRSWTKLPVAVSGGFEPTDPEAKYRRSWDILIVGRGVTEAIDPIAAAQHLTTFIAPDGEGLQQ